jgi:hypothetical protein
MQRIGVESPRHVSASSTYNTLGDWHGRSRAHAMTQKNTTPRHSMPMQRIGVESPRHVSASSTSIPHPGDCTVAPDAACNDVKTLPQRHSMRQSPRPSRRVESATTRQRIIDVYTAPSEIARSLPRPCNDVKTLPQRHSMRQSPRPSRRVESPRHVSASSTSIPHPQRLHGRSRAHAMTQKHYPSVIPCQCNASAWNLHDTSAHHHPLEIGTGRSRAHAMTQKNTTPTSFHANATHRRGICAHAVISSIDGRHHTCLFLLVIYTHYVSPWSL